MPFKSREQLLVAVILLCLAALAGDRLILTPLARTWTGRAKRIAELEKSIARGTLLAGREVSLSERWRQMRAGAASREASVTENEVLSAVNRWAGTGPLTVTAIKPRWNQDEEDCRKLEVLVSGSGNLGAIARFLYELESDPQALKVEDVDLSARDNQGRTLNCDVRFTRLVLEDGKR